jgi:glycosyltransferase involved in cell wall biosynthesis
VTHDGDYWAVIPVYDEAPTIREVALRTLRALPRVIVVDDGSCDGTAEALTGLPVVLLRNRRNRGKAMSLWRGFRYALSRGARGVVTLDGDGQHAPEDITGLLAAARRMPGQLLIGARSRHARRRAPVRGRARYYANRFADFWISWAAGYPIVDSQSGLRFYPRELLGKVKVRHGKTRSFVFESEVLIEGARLGFEARPVPVTARPRLGPRPSHFRPLVDIARITRMVAGRLLARRLYLGGLYRSFRRPVRPMDEPNDALDPTSAAQSASPID